MADKKQTQSTGGGAQNQDQDDLAAKLAAATTDEQDNLQAKIEELTGALARALADLKNIKRRNEEDQGKYIKESNKDLLLALIPLLDNFDRSVQHLPADLKGNEWAKGVVQIHDQLAKSLEKLGVKKVETVGKPLDTKFHEAVMQAPGAANMILEEFEPGYTLFGDPLKPARVKVGNGLSAQDSQKSVDKQD